MWNSDLALTVFITTIIILLLVGGVVIAFIVSNARNERQEMKMVQMQMDYEKELRKVQYEVQEQVLQNVGRELHDNIGQLLTAMHLQLEQHKYLNPEAAQFTEMIGDTLTDTRNEVRRLGKSLNSDLFESQGLINTIQQEVLRLKQLDKYEVSWTYDTEPLLSKDQKVIAFRIFQESLNNIMKHSGATSIHIVLRGNIKFRLEVRDNGKGFDPTATMRSAGGSGLRNMIKRAEMARLACNISSIAGKGTIFTLETT